MNNATTKAAEAATNTTATTQGWGEIFTQPELPLAPVARSGNDGQEAAADTTTTTDMPPVEGLVTCLRELRGSRGKVYRHLCQHSDDKAECFVSQSELMEALGLSKDVVKKSIRTLDRQGYVVRMGLQTRGGRIAQVYQIPAVATMRAACEQKPEDALSVAEQKPEDALPVAEEEHWECSPHPCEARPFGLPECFDERDLTVAAMDITCMSYVEKWTLVAACRYCRSAYTPKMLAGITKLGESTTAQALEQLVEQGVLIARRKPLGLEKPFRCYAPDAVGISWRRSRDLLAIRARADYDAPFGGETPEAVRAECAGLSAVEKWVLVAASTLSHTGHGYSQKGLVRMTGLSLSSVNHALRALEADEWVICKHVVGKGKGKGRGRGTNLYYVANADRLHAEPTIDWRR